MPHYPPIGVPLLQQRRAGMRLPQDQAMGVQGEGPVPAMSPLPPVTPAPDNRQGFQSAAPLLPDYGQMPQGMGVPGLDQVTPGYLPERDAQQPPAPQQGVGAGDPALPGGIFPAEFLAGHRPIPGEPQGVADVSAYKKSGQQALSLAPMPGQPLVPGMGGAPAAPAPTPPPQAPTTPPDKIGAMGLPPARAGVPQQPQQQQLGPTIYAGDGSATLPAGSQGSSPIQGPPAPGRGQLPPGWEALSGDIGPGWQQFKMPGGGIAEKRLDATGAPQLNSIDLMDAQKSRDDQAMLKGQLPSLDRFAHEMFDNAQGRYPGLPLSAEEKMKAATLYAQLQQTQESNATERMKLSGETNPLAREELTTRKDVERIRAQMERGKALDALLLQSGTPEETINKVKALMAGRELGQEEKAGGPAAVGVPAPTGVPGVKVSPEEKLKALGQEHAKMATDEQIQNVLLAGLTGGIPPKEKIGQIQGGSPDLDALIKTLSGTENVMRGGTNKLVQQMVQHPQFGGKSKIQKDLEQRLVDSHLLLSQSLAGSGRAPRKDTYSGVGVTVDPTGSAIDYPGGGGIYRPRGLWDAMTGGLPPMRQETHDATRNKAVATGALLKALLEYQE